MAVWEKQVVKLIEYSLPVDCWAGDLEDALKAARLDWQMTHAHYGPARQGDDSLPADYARVSVSADGKRFVIRVTVPDSDSGAYIPGIGRRE